MDTPFVDTPFGPPRRRSTTKKLCDKDLAERSGVFPGAICLNTPRLLGTLSFLSLFFWNSLFFSPCEEFLVFLSVFPFFSRDFWGSVGIKNPECFQQVR